jgi:hypothetical protein
MMLLFQVFLSVVITLSLIQIRKNPFRNNSRRAMLLFQVFSLSCYYYYYYYYYCHLIQIRKNSFRNNSRRAVSVLIFQFLLASFVIISNAVITLEVIQDKKISSHLAHQQRWQDVRHKSENFQNLNIKVINRK